MNNHLLNAEFNEPLLCRSVRIGSFKVHPPANTSLININLSMDGMLFDVPMVTDKGKIITILLKPCDISIMMVHFGRNLPIVFVFTTSSFAEALRKSLNMSDGDHAYFDPNSNDEKQKKIAFLVDRVNYRHRHFLQHGFLPKRRVVELDKKTANEILVKSTPNQIHFAQNQRLFRRKAPPKLTKSATNTDASSVDFFSIKNVHLQEQGGKAVAQKSVPANKMHLWEWAKMYRNVQCGHSYNLRALVQPQIVAENQATTITGFPLVQLGHVKRILHEERGKSIAIPPLKITKTTATTKAPLMEFDYVNNIHFLEQGNSPITQSSVPVNKMHLMDWTRMSKNIQEDQSNNLRVEVGRQNVAETEQFQMNCLKHFHKNFKHAEKFQNGSHSQLKSFTALVQLEVDDLVKNNIKYSTDSTTQFKNGCERQLSCSTIEVHPEKSENVHIKMEYVTEPSEQFENGCEEQPSSLVTGVFPEKDDLVQVKMEFVAEPSEQFESVEQFKTDCERQPCSSITGVYGEKDKITQIKMEFTTDSSDQVENVEPWNMLITELSTPNVIIETQNDVSALISVKSSISDTWNLSDPNHHVPLFYPIANISKMKYSAELKEVEKLNVCGAGEQLNSSETEVLPEKNGNMQIKLESSKQIENIES